MIFKNIIIFNNDVVINLVEKQKIPSSGDFPIPWITTSIVFLEYSNIFCGEKQSFQKINRAARGKTSFRIVGIGPNSGGSDSHRLFSGWFCFRVVYDVYDVFSTISIRLKHPLLLLLSQSMIPFFVGQ